MRRLLAVAATAAAVALAVFTVAAPASAATLPAGQKITIIDSHDDAGPDEGPYYDVNPADAAATPVGTGSGTPAYGLDVNDDGFGYEVGDYGTNRLYKADANTGTISDPKVLELAGGGEDEDLYNCRDIDLNPVTGELLIVCVVFSNEIGNVGIIGSIDTATGLVTPVVSMPPQGLTFDAIATDPVTGTLWVFGYDEGYQSYIVDRALQTATEVAPMDNTVDGADFDRNGQLFITSYIDQGVESLAVVDPNVGTFTFHEPFIDTATGEELTDVYPITVWGKEALPATGPAVVVPLGLGAALLFLAGAAFVAIRWTHRLEGTS